MTTLTDRKRSVDAVDAVDGAFFAPLRRNTEFILIRHGESEGNAAGLFQGRLDLPLTDAGRAQAADRGRSLFRRGEGGGGALLYCSPLSRAVESARIIAREAALKPPRIADELMELDTGSWTGLSWSRAQAERPDEWKRFHGMSWAGIADAERPEALFDRAVRAWTLLRDAAVEEDSGTVIAVTHGGFLQWLVRATFGGRTWFPLIPAHNCAAFRLKAEPVTDSGAFIAWEAIDERPDAALGAVRFNALQGGAAL